MESGDGISRKAAKPQKRQHTRVAEKLMSTLFASLRLCVTLAIASFGLILWKDSIPVGIAVGFAGWLTENWMKELQDVTLTLIFKTVHHGLRLPDVGAVLEEVRLIEVG